MNSCANNLILILIIIRGVQLSYAQDNVPFSQDHAYYLKGGAITIGNNILSERKYGLSDKTNPINDVVNMTYIDIDEDPTTFSSSAANIQLLSNSQIVSATLYWSGTYAGTTGSRKINRKEYVYNLNEDRTHDFTQVKLKINGSVYQNTQGTKIYDGSTATNSILQNNKPYVCKVDVTALLNQADALDRITVANIAATEGFIEGGSAAGWLLYIIYEHVDAPPQFITSFSGFQIVKDEKVTVSITDFHIPDNESSSSIITIGALDGDYSLKGDQVTIINPYTEETYDLRSQRRPKRNFFNSTIHYGDGPNFEPIPNDVNTLGVIAQIAVESKSILPKNSNKLDIVYATKANGFYVFFTAFQTQIDEAFLDKQGLPDLLGAKQTALETVIQTAAIVAVKPAGVAPKQAEPGKTKPGKSAKSSKTLNKVTGFYVVTNAFNNPENAYNWKLLLLDLGYQPLSFIHPVNKIEHPYIASGKNEEELFDALQEALTYPELGGAWIKEMN